MMKSQWLGLTSRIAAVIVSLHVFAPRAAHADEVDDLITLVRGNPGDLDEVEWKDKRRDAARKLGESGDKRAVPALIKVVEEEEFDVVGEIAIDALGKLGDQRAAQILQRVVSDPGREADQKRAAKRALDKLGIEAEVASSGGGDDSDGTGASLLTSGAVGGSDSDAEPVKPANFDADILGAVNRITFALGGVSLQYDTIRQNPSFTGDLAASYLRSRDYTRWAYRVTADVGVAGGMLRSNDDGESSRSVNLNTGAYGEARFYLSGVPVYGIGLMSTRFTLTDTFTGIPNDDDIDQTLGAFDVQAGIGGGYGRMLEKGEAIRLRRIEMVLRKERLLGRPIEAEVAEKVFAAWWALRGEVGAYRRLTTTVKILREAGVMLGEPTAGTAYELLQVLIDGQLNRRQAGIDTGLAIVESYLARESELPVEDGRIESAIAWGRFAKQSENGENELLADGYARIRLLAGSGEASPWAAGAGVTWRRYFYGDYLDPIGALEFTGHVAASDDDIDQVEAGYTVGGSMGWLWIPNRASRFRLAGDVRMMAQELFLGVTFDVNYGFLDSVFLSGGALPPTISE